MTKLNAAGATNTREAIVNAIQTFYDNEVLGYYPINQNTVSDIKDEETKLYKRSIHIGGFQFYTRLGVLYNNMKNRCKVGGSVQKNQPQYFGCTMCEEWLGEDGFENYSSWCQHQIGMYQVDTNGESFQCDKDLLSVEGKKYYSPNTCTFLPREINLAIAAKDSKGYRITPNGKYQVSQRHNGLWVNIGLFNTEKQAIAAWRKVYKSRLKQLAKKYKNQISIEAYEALMRYKQA